MAKLVRLTTPTFIFATTDNVDFRLVDDLHVTFSSYGVIIDKYGEDVSIVESNRVSVYLRQEDTYKFHVGKCEVMLNWVYSDGSRGSSDPDHPIIIEVTKNLLDKII